MDQYFFELTYFLQDLNSYLVFGAQGKSMLKNSLTDSHRLAVCVVYTISPSYINMAGRGKGGKKALNKTWSFKLN